MQWPQAVEQRLMGLELNVGALAARSAAQAGPAEPAEQRGAAEAGGADPGRQCVELLRQILAVLQARQAGEPEEARPVHGATPAVGAAQPAPGPCPAACAPGGLGGLPLYWA